MEILLNITSGLCEVASDLEKSERPRDSHMAEAQGGVRIFQSGTSNLGKIGKFLGNLAKATDFSA